MYRQRKPSTKVSDMVKMYSQNNVNSARTRPGMATARQWPPVATPGATPSNKPPPPMALKPNTLGSPTMNGGRPMAPPKPFGARMNDNHPTHAPKPFGARTNENNHAHAPKPFGARTNENHPVHAPKPFGARTNDTNPASWKRNQHNETANNTPHWKKPQPDPEPEDHNETPDIDPNMPAWKRELLLAKKQKAATHQNLNKPSWGGPPENTTHHKPVVPAFKPQPDTSHSGPQWGKPTPPKPSFGYKADENTTHTGPQWGKSAVPPKPTPAVVPWSQRNQQQHQQDEDKKLPPPPLPDAPKPSSVETNAPKRPPFGMFNSTPKPPGIVKSSGSFGSVPTPKENDEITSPKRRVSSFLHTKPSAMPPPPMNFQPVVETPPPPPAADKPSRANGVPTRLKIPAEKYYEIAPIKASKPPSVVLPKGKKKFSLPSLPGGFLSRSSRDNSTNNRDLPPPSQISDLPLPPPPGGSSRDLPLPPSMGDRGLPQPPPVGGRDLPFPPPGGARDLPQPPPPGGRDLPQPPPVGGRDLPLPPAMGGPPSPNLPPRPAGLSLPGPALPSRPLPSPILGKKSMPLPPAPNPEPDDIYDDPGEEPPPPLPIPTAEPAEEMIETWDDEEGADAIYDETPDEPIGKPMMPAGFPMPGAPVPIPEENEDTYEDADATEYMRLKRLQQQNPTTNGSVNGNEGIKKDKKTSKKEKEIRKKFKLPAEGDIVPQGHAIVQETCKGGGWGKGSVLTVEKGEQIEVIRMTDCPKGKWLARNAQGEYGHVDSDKVQIQLSELRNQFGVGSTSSSGIVGGPPPIPTEDDEDDVIYDETADDGIYEEL